MLSNAMRAQFFRRAVEIASGIEYNGGVGVGPFRVVEIVQNSLCPVPAGSGRQFEDNTAASSAARPARAVEVAGGVEDQVAIAYTAPVCAIEVMQNFLPPTPARFGHQLEHVTVVAIIADTAVRGAVEITGGVEDLTRHGVRPRPRR